MNHEPADAAAALERSGITSENEIVDEFKAPFSSLKSTFKRLTINRAKAVASMKASPGTLVV